MLLISLLASIAAAASAAQNAPQSWKDLRTAVTLTDEITLGAAADLTADYDGNIDIPAGTSVELNK